MRIHSSIASVATVAALALGLTQVAAAEADPPILNGVDAQRLGTSEMAAVRGTALYVSTSTGGVWDGRTWYRPVEDNGYLYTGPDGNYWAYVGPRPEDGGYVEDAYLYPVDYARYQDVGRYGEDYTYTGSPSQPYPYDSQQYQPPSYQPPSYQPPSYQPPSTPPY